MIKKQDLTLKNQEVPKAHYVGHRARLRSRFLANARMLSNYELLELILGYTCVRGDTKPMAKTLLLENEDMLSLMMANLSENKQLSVYQKTLFLLICEMQKRMHGEHLRSIEVLHGVHELKSFARTMFMGLKIEQFGLIYLNSKMKVLGHEMLWEGTIDHSAIYPREVIKHALENNAAHLVLVHNHPSGDCLPSRDDLFATEKIRAAAMTLGIRVYDHLIVSHNEVYSMHEAGQI